MVHDFHKIKILNCFILILFCIFLFSACTEENNRAQKNSNAQIANTEFEKEDVMNIEQKTETEQIIISYGNSNSKIKKIEKDFSYVRFNGDYGFEDFISRGGAYSDKEVVEFLAERFTGLSNLKSLTWDSFGCSTISATTSSGEKLFGRNFDWQECDALVVLSYPETGYSSVSTVNMDFITQNIKGGILGMAFSFDSVKTIAALYAPLDGMNEAGLAVAVNMIQDSAATKQRTGKPGLTTTTAVRLLLNKAATVEEALNLLASYDFNSSMGMVVHFAITDKSGRSVAVEYIDQKMNIIETPILTNFYLTPGKKYGIGTTQSKERYEILKNALETNQYVEEDKLKTILDSVSKDNFEEFTSTEWSIVFNLSKQKAIYFHRENYKKAYVFQL